LLSRTQLANDLFLDSEKKWILVTLHPETKKTIDENLNIAQNMMNVLIRDSDMEIIITQANADLGGYQMNELYSFLSRKYSFVHYIKSLGQLRYLSMMNEVSCIIGNSSSGIVEAPYLGIPVVNIGDRQKGRYLCSNIFCCGVDEKDIENSFNKAVTHEKFKPNYYFGNGYSSDVIIENIVKFLDIS
jgi:UDP-N-acetylglucosamine 2-epimerase